MTSSHWVVLAGALALLWPSAAAAGPQEKAMAQNIAQQVKQSGQLSNYRLGVAFQDGVATLSGSVADPGQAQAAIKVASRVAGVQKVVNKLDVQSRAARQPQAKQEQSRGLLMSLTESARPATGRSSRKPTAKRNQQRLQPRRINNTPMPMARSGMPGVMPANYSPGRVNQAQCAGCNNGGYGGGGGAGYAPGGGGGYASGGGGAAGASYDSANLPGYAWPSYAAYPNYSALTYPKQYSPTAWPYIGPFYPYPQVPLGWRKVSLEWDDGWWFLDFSHHQNN